MEVIIFNLILILLSFLPPPASSCTLLLQAFSSVSNFQPPTPAPACSDILHLRLPSSNLSGTLSWAFLNNLTSLRSLDLSSNSLHGSLPASLPPSLLLLDLSRNRLGGALRFPGPLPSSLQHLNLSGNRLTSASLSPSALPSLRSLDLSANRLASVPSGLDGLRSLEHLDLSLNSMTGVFPTDFPAINQLKYLNVSFNNLTGSMNASTVDKFGRSAFIRAGTLQTDDEQHHQHHHNLVVIIAAASVAAVVTASLLILLFVIIMRAKRRRRRSKKWEEEEQGVRSAEEVAGWVAEARWGAPVVVFEKPLLELAFSDLAAATSGFGKEAVLAEGSGRSGPVYRASLPGDLQVVVRVMESLRELEERETETRFRELARLRHPNLLPLLGYCITGKEKLVLYEYMERGDLHQWLHELPAGKPDSEDLSGEAWEPQPTAGQTTSTVRDWPARHKIALGIARGIAFLHQGWAGSRRPIVHGHLIASNVLLDDNLEPRIADFAAEGGEETTTESNVYSYGLLVFELVTARRKWTSEEVEKVRKSVRDGKGLREVDLRMRVEEGSEGKWESEMVECLRVGYLCTAQAPEKRPTMQQVVGLIKDIRPSSATMASASSSSS